MERLHDGIDYDLLEQRERKKKKPCFKYVYRSG